jgi:hypothetical protein
MSHKIDLRHNHITKSFLVHPSTSLDKLENLILESFQLESPILGLKDQSHNYYDLFVLKDKKYQNTIFKLVL